VQLMKRIAGSGLGMMGAVALAAAIWPAVASLVTGLLVTLLCVGTGTLVMLGGRRLHLELAGRREWRTMPPLDAATYGDVAYGDVAGSPTLAQLQESA
jgi:hypothetical protein